MEVIKMKKSIIGKCEQYTTTIWSENYEIEFPDEFISVEEYVNYLRENDESAYVELMEKIYDLDEANDKVSNSETVLFYTDMDGDNLRYEDI